MSNKDDELREMLEAKFNEIFDDLDDDLSDAEDGPETIVLNDENGNEVEFEFMDLVEYEGEEYVILLPVEDTEDAGQVVILRLDHSDGEEESFSSVDDDEVLQAVFEVFKEKFKDEFNFVD